MKLSTDIGRPPRMKFILEDSSTWTESVVMTTAKSRYRAVAYLVRDKVTRLICDLCSVLCL